MKGIGIMSGSSLDGLDLALVDFSNIAQGDWSLIQSETFDLESNLKKRLHDILNQNAWDIAKTQSLFSKFVSDSILSFISGQPKVDFCAIHGHTVLHAVEDQFSWQLLNGGYVSQTVRLNVVCDFRNQDMALGGQGTPMAVLADKYLFSNFDYYINLGGIANISYHQNDKWAAYDLFPFNQVLNYYAQKCDKEFDANGDLGRSGVVSEKLLDALSNEDYIKKPFPKSIDNSWIHNYWIKRIESYKLNPQDSIRTYMEFAVQVVKRIINKKQSKLLMTGGGAHNKYFIELLSDSLNQCRVEVPERNIVDYKEAILIAYAGYLRIMGQSNFINDATGATEPTIGGAVYLTNKNTDS